MEEKKRILALDIGEVRIGTAISDPLGICPSTLEPVTGQSKKEKFDKILNIITKYSPGLIVVGFPLNLDGTQGIAAEKIKKFIKELKKLTPVPIEKMDERMTTKEAQNLLISADVRRDKRKHVVDGMSAVLILQKYLEIQRGREKKPENGE